MCIKRACIYLLLKKKYKKGKAENNEIITDKLLRKETREKENYPF